MRSLLGIPKVYEIFRKLVGGDSTNKRLIQEFICPFKRARILDIGCGPGSMLQHLPRDIEYVGVDQSPEYIKYASSKFNGHAKFFCNDVQEIDINKAGQFDIVIAIGLVHHINDEDVKKLFKFVNLSLKKNGFLVTADVAYLKGQPLIAKYIVSMDRGKYVRDAEEYIELAKPSFSSVQPKILHNLLNIPCTHLIMKCFKNLNGS